MQLIAGALVVLVAALHLFFLVLEMFLWTAPWGRRTFRTTAEFATATRALAANQGLYNGFLSAGLVWGLVAYGIPGGRPVITFFLICVVIAGVFGAVTVSRRILFVQAVPALLAGVFLWLA